MMAVHSDDPEAIPAMCIIDRSRRPRATHQQARPAAANDLFCGGRWPGGSEWGWSGGLGGAGLAMLAGGGGAGWYGTVDRSVC